MSRRLWPNLFLLKNFYFFNLDIFYKLFIIIIASIFRYKSRIQTGMTGSRMKQFRLCIIVHISSLLTSIIFLPFISLLYFLGVLETRYRKKSYKPDTDTNQRNKIQIQIIETRYRYKS